MAFHVGDIQQKRSCALKLSRSHPSSGFFAKALTASSTVQSHRGSITCQLTLNGAEIADASTSTAIDSVFTANDLIGGILAALALAGTAILLDNRPSETLPEDANDLKIGNNTNTAATAVIFDSWEEMRKPDNYVWYNTQLRNRMNPGALDADEKVSSNVGQEQRWVLFALIALFAPIFSIEFFLTVSRQVLCSGFAVQSFELARTLCAPSHTPLP